MVAQLVAAQPPVSGCREVTVSQSRAMTHGAGPGRRQLPPFDVLLHKCNVDSAPTPMSAAAGASWIRVLARADRPSPFRALNPCLLDVLCDALLGAGCGAGQVGSTGGSEAWPEQLAAILDDS